MFADLSGLLRLFGADQEGLGALDAAGMTTQGGADGQFRLRVTLRPKEHCGDRETTATLSVAVRSPAG